MSALSREVFWRMATVRAYDPVGMQVLEDAVDQFTRIATMADGQREHLQGGIECQQARTNTRTAVAAGPPSRRAAGP